MYPVGLIIALGLELCWCCSASSVNLALHKPTEMSSRWYIADAKYAVDGDLMTRIHTEPDQPFGWFSVDLLTDVMGGEIRLHFRLDYKFRRNGLQFYTSPTAFSSYPGGNLCHTVTGMPNGEDIPDVINVTCPGLWRHLLVYTDTGNDGGGPLLDFQEIKVLVNLLNVALNRPFEFSSVHPSNDPQVVVDGDATSVPPNIMATDINQDFGWCKLDLQTDFNDALIQVFFEIAFKYQRSGLQVYTSSTPFSTVPGGQLCHTVNGEYDGSDIPDVLSVTCPGVWRHLLIYTQSDTDGHGARLILGEVQVLVTPCAMALQPAPTAACTSFTINQVRAGMAISEADQSNTNMDRRGCSEKCVRMAGCLQYSLSITGVCRLSSKCYPLLEEDPQTYIFSVVCTLNCPRGTSD